MPWGRLNEVVKIRSIIEVNSQQIPTTNFQIGTLETELLQVFGECYYAPVTYVRSECDYMHMVYYSVYP